ATPRDPHSFPTRRSSDLQAAYCSRTSALRPPQEPCVQHQRPAIREPTLAASYSAVMATNSMSGLHVGISGSYGGINLGDEAILQSLLAQLRSTLEPRAITVFTRDPADTLARHAVDRAVAVREMTREEARAEIRQ